jgi:hypothetical protein
MTKLLTIIIAFALCLWSVPFHFSHAQSPIAAGALFANVAGTNIVPKP